MPSSLAIVTMAVTTSRVFTSKSSMKAMSSLISLNSNILRALSDE